jgi:mRNA interferase MazF
MRKGDIILVPFPFTNLSDQKIRPALVLFTRPKNEDIIVAFISSTPSKKDDRFEVVIQPSEINGLKVSSRIRLNKLATLEKKIVVGQLGELDAKSLREVRSILRKMFS